MDPDAVGMVVGVGPDIGVLILVVIVERELGSFGRGKVWDFQL